MDISKKDLKLFRERLSGWQENYMEGLVKEYANFLNDDKKPASEKFWELEKRIKEDKRQPGVIIFFLPVIQLEIPQNNTDLNPFFLFYTSKYVQAGNPSVFITYNWFSIRKSFHFQIDICNRRSASGNCTALRSWR